VNQRDKHGNTPLIVCCQVGNKRAVKLFLKAAADANASNVSPLISSKKSFIERHLTPVQHQGNTALHYSHKCATFSHTHCIILKLCEQVWVPVVGRVPDHQRSRRHNAEREGPNVL
jgi:hypothetical protein